MREEAKKIRCEESKDGRAVEEFMPLKRNSDEVEDVNLGGDSSDKKSWMSSAQLWSSNVDYDSQKQNPVSELKKVNFTFTFPQFCFWDFTEKFKVLIFLLWDYREMRKTIDQFLRIQFHHFCL